MLLLTVGLLLWALPPWRINFQVPLHYDGDGILNLMFTKTIVENGWYLHNPAVGTPTGLDLTEFPAVDTLPGLIIKGFGLFTHEPALINNLFFLLTFPLTSLGALFVCRRLGIASGPAGLASLLYAFLPYHFYRSTGHLYLSAYFVAPFPILVAWWVATGRLLAAPAGQRWRRPLLAAGLCAVTSLAGVYYPFFAGLLLGTGSLYAGWARRDFRHLLAGMVLAGVLVGGLLVCLAPTLAYLSAHPHSTVSQRQFSETETFGLKIVQLVLPTDHHRLHAWRRLRWRYDQSAPLVTENGSASLGVAGAGGFLLLLGFLLFRPVDWRRRPLGGPDDPPAGETAPTGQPMVLQKMPLGLAPGETPPALREILEPFAVLNGAGLLFATIGGLGTLFALFVSPQVRSVNRVSVYLAFLALAALAACLEAALRRWADSPGRRALGWVVLGLLLILGALDQITPADFDYYRATHREFRADRNFYRQIQAQLPPGGRIFQLPYSQFPEGGPVEKMEDYSHLRGYIHTTGLRWSYGVMRGGYGDLWEHAVPAQPAVALVRQLALSGFDGICLERAGYADDGEALDADLRGLLGPPTAFRLRREFFNLAVYTRSLRASLTPDQWRRQSALALHPLLPDFLVGFGGQESSAEHTWQWCAGRGELRFENGLAVTRHIQLKMLASTGAPGAAHLTWSTPREQQTWTVSNAPQPLSFRCEIPPGETVLHFLCDAPPVRDSLDPRVLVWDMLDFQWQEEPPAAPAN